MPGSVFKIVTATAGIGSGAITPDTTFPNQPAEYQTGFLVAGLPRPRRPAARSRPTTRSISSRRPRSRATSGSRTPDFRSGPRTCSAGPRKLGFGAPIPFDLPTSQSQVTGGGGPLDGFQDQVELANAAYGQAEVLVTPLQMALVASTIANNGVEMQPKLVDELRAQSGAVPTLGPPGAGACVACRPGGDHRQAMSQAVEGQYGERSPAEPRCPACRLRARAATAQLGDGSAATAGSSASRRRTAPQIAIAVIVERGGAGVSGPCRWPAS